MFLEMHLKTGKKIAYIRRYKEDITKPNLETLFDPHEQFVQKETGGAWVGFEYQSRKFRFVAEDGKTKSPVVCDTFSLSAWERQKGSDKGQYCLILFDEFMIENEFTELSVRVFCDKIHVEI